MNDRCQIMISRALAALAALTASAALAQSNVDTIVTNGKILTVDAAFSTAEALAIDDGRIVALGTAEDVAALAGPDTETLDMAGATVVPGLIDNHVHFMRGVERWHRQARLDGVSSRAEALEILAAKARELGPGEWVFTQGGWSPRQFADAPGGFTLAELDAAAPENPLFLQNGYSVVYANSLALEAVGLDPADGAERPAAGLASFEPPQALYDQFPPTSPARRDRNLDAFLRDLNAAGLTGLYSLGASDYLAARAAEAPLPMRIWETLGVDAGDPASATAAAALIERSTPNTFDGRFGTFGLAENLYRPFFDLAPRPDPWPAEIMNEYAKLARAAARGGWHIHEHVINDDAVTALLDTLEEVAQSSDPSVRFDHLRWTLAHIYDISAENVARAKALGMTLAPHGVAMHGGVPLPFRRIADSGVVFGLGTDTTIVSHFQPFVTIGWAVSGLDLAGRRVLDETLTREEALTAHTRGNAYLFFQEDNLGSLEVGKEADLVVLDRDYMTVPAAEIKDIRAALTMVGGQVVYRADP